MASLKEKSLKGLFWDFTGNIGLQGVGFFVSIILARLLAPADFGLLAIIMAFITLAGAFVDMGFSTALIQHREVQETHYASVFYMNVGLGIVFAILVFVSAPYLAVFYGNPQLTNLTRFMSLSFVVNSFGNVPRAKLRREMNFKAISVTNIFAAIISGIGAIFMALNGYGIWSLAVQSITNQFLANTFLYSFYRQRFNLRFSLQSIKELWGFGFRMFFSGLIDTLFINIDSMVIGKVLNISTLGYYYRAKSLENFSTRYTASSIASVLFPALSSLQNQPEKQKQIIIKMFHLLSFVSFLICGLLLVGGREIIILLFSIKWEPSVLLFQIIIAGAFSSQIFCLFYNTLLSTGNVKSYVLINVVSKILLTLNLATLIVSGLTTYLVIFTAINLFTFFMGMFSVTRILNLGDLFYRQTIKYFFIYGGTVGFVFMIETISAVDNLFLGLLMESFVFSVIFCLLAFLTRCDGLILLRMELSGQLRRIMGRQ